SSPDIALLEHGAKWSTDANTESCHFMPWSGTRSPTTTAGFLRLRFVAPSWLRAGRELPRCGRERSSGVVCAPCRGNEEAENGPAIVGIRPYAETYDIL